MNLAGSIGDLIQGNKGPNPDQRAGQDRDYAERMWRERLQAARPNQRNARGDTREWTQDENGRWVQTDRYSAERQAQYDLYNQIAQARMAQAQGMKLPGGSIDWNALGYGHLANAVGAQPGGTTGQRPWANTQSPYSNLGGRGMGPNTNPNQDWRAFASGPAAGGYMMGGGF